MSFTSENLTSNGFTLPDLNNLSVLPSSSLYLFSSNSTCSIRPNVSIVTLKCADLIVANTKALSFVCIGAACAEACVFIAIGACLLLLVVVLVVGCLVLAVCVDFVAGKK